MRAFYKAHFVVSGWNGQYLKEDEINLHGSRGRKINFLGTDLPKVVLLGDSQVVASTSSLDEMPESLLEKFLFHNISCTSIAAGGWGQDQQLLHLERFFENNEADVVVLWFTPMNDVANNIFPTHFPENGWAKPTFWLENDKLMGPNEEQNSLVYATPRLHILEPLKLLLQKPFIFDRDGKWEITKLPSNEQCEKAPSTEKQINSFVDRFNINSTEHWFHKYENFENGKNSFSLWIDKTSERLEYGIKLTTKLLHKIKEVCEQNDAKFIIFTAETKAGYNEFPSRKFDQPFEYFRVKDKIYLFSHKAYLKNMQNIMKGLPFISIDISLKRWWRSKDDSHLNKNANSEVMKKLAHHISKLIPSSF
jgi:hypothetical protein